MNTDQIEQLKLVPAWKVIGERVKLRRQGNEWVGLCPFHGERTPSFKVYQDKGGTWLWRCFGCNLSGNAFQFLQKADNLTFQAAVERVAEIAGVELDDVPGVKGADVDRVFRPAVAAPQTFKVVSPERWMPYERDLAASQETLDWLLRERGITAETAKRMRLGLFHDLRAIFKNHPRIGEPWLGFPCFRGGKVVSIKLRLLSAKEFARVPEMETALFNEDAIDPLGDTMLVEGECDVIVLEQAGFPAVSVPSAGFTLTPEMRDAISGGTALYLAGDTDEPGRQYMEKLWRELGGTTYMLAWPDGAKDANEFFMKHCGRDVEKFSAAVERLKQEARRLPMPSFYSLGETMLADRGVSPLDDPNRMLFPWKGVNEMAILLPGDVVSIFSTYTGTGKSTWAMNALVEEALRGQVVVVYSAEIAPARYADMATSYLTMQKRLRLTPEDYHRAAGLMGESRFYVGYNPNLNTITHVLDLLEGAIRRLGATRIVMDGFHFLCRNSSDQVREQENAMQRIKNLAVKYLPIFFVIGQAVKNPQQMGRGKVEEVVTPLGSRAFMDDADAVFHLHRDLRRNIDWGNPPKDLLDEVTDVRLRKGRNMGEGRAAERLYLRGDICRFFESSGAQPDFKERQAGLQE